VNPTPTHSLTARRALPFWIACSLGIALSFAAFFLARQQEVLRAEAEFFRRADIHNTVLQASLNRHLESFHSLQRLMQFSSDVTPEEFQQWAQDIAGFQPEIQVVEWCPRVRRIQRGAYEAEAQRRGLTDFSFTERDLAGRYVPATEREEYFPIYYFAPGQGNEMLRGFDIATGQASEELKLARDSGRPAASGRIHMAQNVGQQFGIIVTLPVYQSDLPLESVEQRREAFAGCVRGVFRMSDLLAAAWESVPVIGVDTIVVDASALKPINRVILFHGTSPGDNVMKEASEQEFRAGRHYEARLRVGARTWMFLFRPTAQWWNAQLSWLPHFILAGGLSATLLMAAYMRATARRTEVIESTVAQRTAELQQVNDSLSREITERARTEKELRKTQATLMLAQRIGRVGSWELDVDANRLSWSEETFRIFGRDPETFQPTNEAFFASVHPEDRARVQAASHAALASGTRYEIEHRIQRADGSEAFVHEMAEIERNRAGRAVRLIGSVQDITERQHAEEERQGIERKFQETQKLESLGVLAGGIAHDFNNLLTGILGNACLARLGLPPESSRHDYLEQIELSSQRAADLCKQMLAYSGKGRFAIQRIDLGSLVTETVHLLQLSISKKAVLKLNLAQPLPEVLADATQLRQIIMNLVMNASDAIGDKSGLITIHTSSLRADEEYLNELVGEPDLPAGEYVVLEVTDNGCGMSPETQARIFEPFFTTKFTGRGLGLAAVLGIVRGHKGALKVYSELGHGTTFRLLLPAANAASAETRVERPAPPKWRATGTVLVIDDEESVRLVAGRMLKAIGFEVLTAADGVDGLAVYRAHAEEICAVLLDLTMPRMDGEETFRELRELRADACVVLMIGFNEQEAGARFVGKGLAGFLQKPFTPDELRDRLGVFTEAVLAN